MIFCEAEFGTGRKEGKEGMRDIKSARAGFAFVAAFSAALAASPAAAQTAVKLTLDGSFTGPSAPFFVAQDRGYYRAAGLEVTIDAAAVAAPDPIGRVASGSADFALADINALIKYRDQNPGAAVKALFVVYNKPAYAIIARKSRGIAKPKDLEGRKLGAPAADAATAQWPLFAKLNEIDPTKVTLENLALPVREPMLAAGQVDAVAGISFSSYIDLKDRGVPTDDLVVLPMADFGLQLYGDAIVASPKFLAENPQAAKAFLQAFLKGLKDTIRDPARAIESVLKRNEAAKKELELERLRMVIRDNIVTAEVKANGLGGVDPARLARAIDQIAHTYKFKGKPEAPDIFDASFLPPPAERRVVNEPQRPG
jgi:NitT/TauT family transport system substrate-binding protein